MSYDIAINNAIIIDGTGRKQYKGNIGIRNEIIEVIIKDEENLLNGDLIINCHGKLVAAPGFIDMHSHSDLAIFKHKNSNFYKLAAICKVSQGITTEIVGQDGFSAGPIENLDREEYLIQWRGLTGYLPPDKWKWNNIEEYLKAVKLRNFPTKIETLVGHNTIRINVMGYEKRKPTQFEKEEMQELLRKSLKQGAKGLSLGLIYPPGTFAEKDELIDLAKIVAQEKGVIFAHIRNESDSMFSAIEEFLDIHKSAKVRANISHLKICGVKNFNQGEYIEKLILKTNNINNENLLSFDLYPYDAGSTVLHAILPPWTHEGGPKKLIERLKDEKTCIKIAKEVFKEEEYNWENFISFSKGGLDGIMINNAPKAYQNIIGKSLSDIGREQGFDPSSKEGKLDTFIFICKLLVETRLDITMISFNQSMKNVERFMAMNNNMTIGTDGIIGPSPHPRLLGSFPKYLKWINKNKANQKQKNSLERAIHNITKHAADVLGLNDRGIIKVGKVGDITIFDSNKITDRATWKNSKIVSEGISYVFVNGELVHQKSMINPI